VLARERQRHVPALDTQSGICGEDNDFF